MTKIKSIIIAAAAIVMASCTSDLDQKPVIGNTSEQVYSTLEGYQSVLAKIYGSYSLVGQERAGNPDLSSNQGQDLIRNLFNLQESSTDEVAQTWLSGDNQTAITYMTWDANDVWVSDTYYRLFYSVALCNEFLRYCGEGSISKFTAAEQDEIRIYAAEARFIRALDYYFVLDLFRKGPNVNESTPTTGVIPEAYDGKQLYTFIDSEIKAIENILPETNEYGRAGRTAAWALGVRLALNGEVYTGESHYTECITYAKKIIDLNRYTLEENYSGFSTPRTTSAQTKSSSLSQLMQTTPPHGAPQLILSAQPAATTAHRIRQSTASATAGATGASAESFPLCSQVPRTLATPSGATASHNILPALSTIRQKDISARNGLTLQMAANLRATLPRAAAIPTILCSALQKSICPQLKHSSAAARAYRRKTPATGSILYAAVPTATTPATFLPTSST